MLRHTIALLGAALFAMSVTPAQANVALTEGFEDGASGWTKWAANWSSAAVLSATAVPEAAYTGAYGLKLQINGFSSCGVYRQVAVTPGMSYKLDGMWKSPNSAGRWFEAIILDGPWDLFQADDPSVVYNNVVAGYDSAFNPAPASFGWEPFSATYSVAPVIVDGARVASGNVMTIVLKLGGSNSIAYFDDVTLTEIPEPASLLALVGGMGLFGLLRRGR